MNRLPVRSAFLVLLLAGIALIATTQEAPSLNLATWNIRELSDGSRDGEELSQVARIIQLYDFVAIQELNDTEVLERLQTRLPHYSYVTSERVGRSPQSSERYAFLYRSDRVTVVAPPQVYPDQNDWFIREPFVGHFRAGEFDFTVVTVHIFYGDGPSERRPEIARLDDVIRWADEINGDEADVLLVGDFNMDVADSAWEMAPWVGLVAPVTPTTISDRSSYDNIWYNPAVTTELLIETYHVFRFDEEIYANDDRLAGCAVSDHRPVSVRFSTAGPDDDGSVAGDARTGVTSAGLARVRFLHVVAHPTSAESVTLVNLGGSLADLSGWRLGDLNDPLAYRIPQCRRLGAGETHTFPHTTLPFGINNSNEELFLYDSEGNLVDHWRN